MPDPKTLLLLVLVAAVQGCSWNTTLGNAPRLAVGLEAVSNTFDGSARSECAVRVEAEAGRTQEAWISFGKVKRQGERGWESVSSITRCGEESFDTGSALLGRAGSIPYIIADIETRPAVRPDGKAELRTKLEIRKFSAFDDKGRPVYARSTQQRGVALGRSDEAIIPLLLANSREQDAFDVRELFLRLEARVLGRDVTAYGTISVAADVPGVDLLLDGGRVGRTPEKGPAALRNVRVGKHEVRVRDFSRRTAREEVIVEPDRMVEVALKLLNLPSSATSSDLVPIGKNPQGHEEYWRTKDGAVVVKVPAGEFLMGGAERELGGEPTERPQHQVFVTEFLMDKTEVTWRQFREFAKATGAKLPPAPIWGTPGDYAAGSVLFDEAKAYCVWVGGRLPTEAEWEKAARGTDGRTYPWGNEWDPDRCHSLAGGAHRPESVGSFPGCVSPYGVLDLGGGVWEWVADWYAGGYSAAPARDPRGPVTGTQRVLRGGAWINMFTSLRTANRQKSTPDWRNVHYGFRCAQDVPQ